MKSKLFIIGLLFLSTNIRSQVGVTNTGILYIKSGSDIFYTAGSFTNSSSASFTNNGALYVKGNLSNSQSSMATGTGTLYLNGSSAQAVNGTQTFKTFNLNTNNSAGITLNNDLDVSGTHSFTAGIITTSATPNYLIYESGSSYTGASDAKHVFGWVKKFGSTNFIFPVGNNIYLREISLQNLSVSSEFNVQYSGPTYDPNSVLYPISSMNPMEHWTVNKISGGNAQVQLNWDSSKVPFPNYYVPDLRATLYSATQWINEGGTATGSVATTGTITSNSISSFGRMAIGSISFPLPLKFIGISAIAENASVHLRWKTASEIGVETYSVQRSIDGINFSTIATLTAKNGNLQTYDYLDLNLPSSKIFYRICCTDFDGKTAYSGIVVVKSDSRQKMLLVNNPVNTAIQLSTQNMPSTVYFYALMNSAGQVCKKGSFSCEGSTLTTIGINGIAAGSYTLVILNAKEKKEFKLLIR